MGIFININGSDYPIEDGSVLTDVLGSELDSFSNVSIGSTSADIKIKPLQKAAIHGGMATDREMTIGYYYKSQKTFGASPKYRYDFLLVSEAKWLERRLMPNKSFTKRTTGTALKTYEAIIQLLRLYMPKVRQADASANVGWSWAYSWDVDVAGITAKFSGDCPEFQWNKPTLREALTSLMATEGCIPAIIDGIVTFVDLRKKEAVDEGDPITSDEEGDASTYSDCLVSDIQNASGGSTVLRKELLSLTPSDGGIMTTNNCVLKTSFNIKKIVKLEVVGPLAQAAHIFNFRAVDITAACKEKKVYDALSSVQINIQDASPNFSYCSTYKQANVYYSRGSNEIAGFGYGVKGFWPWENYSAIGTILRAVLGSGIRIMRDGLYSDSINANPYDELVYQVEYEALDERAMASYPRNAESDDEMNDEISDGQDSSFADIVRSADAKQSKADKLHSLNYPKHFSAGSESLLPALGSADSSGRVLFKRSMTFGNNRVTMIGQYAYDYALTDYFTAVDSEVRDSSLASESDSFTRLERHNTFVVFSSTQRSVAYPYFGLRVLTAWAIGSMFRFADDLSITDAVLNFSNSVGGSKGYFVSDVWATASNTQVNFVWKANDNVSVGDNLVYQDQTYLRKFVPYVDDEGEFVNVDAIYRHGTKSAYKQSGAIADAPFLGQGVQEYTSLTTPVQFFDEQGNLVWTDPIADYKPQINLMPSITSAEYQSSGRAVAETAKSIFKDDREIIGVDEQLTFISTDPNTFVGKGMALGCPLAAKPSRNEYWLNSAEAVDVASWDDVPTSCTPEPYYLNDPIGDRPLTQSFNWKFGEHWGVLVHNTATGKYRLYYCHLNNPNDVVAYGDSILDAAEFTFPSYYFIEIDPLKAVFKVASGKLTYGLTNRDENILGTVGFQIQHGEPKEWMIADDGRLNQTRRNRLIGYVSTDAEDPYTKVDCDKPKGSYHARVTYSFAQGTEDYGGCLTIFVPATGTDGRSVASWALVDDDGRVVICGRRVGFDANTNEKKIYVALDASPSTSIYDSKGSQTIVATLSNSKAEITTANANVPTRASSTVQGRVLDRSKLSVIY